MLFSKNLENYLNLVCRIAVAICFFLLISMMFISYEDDKLFYALLWFVLPICHYHPLVDSYGWSLNLYVFLWR